MNIKKHFILAIIGVLGWMFFYLSGLPSDYYQTWSLSEQILLIWITLFGALPVIFIITIILLKEDYLKTGIWLGFYACVIPFLLDFLVCGLIQGKGFSYLITHWYITVGYLIVWIGPLLGYALKVFKARQGYE